MPLLYRVPATLVLPCRFAACYLRRAGIFSLLVLVLAGCQSAPRGQVSFQRIILAERVPANGQLQLADLGGDSAIDILLMSRQPGRLSWFENPHWELHQIPLIADVLHGVAAYSPAGQSSAGSAGIAVNGRFSQPGSGTRQQLLWLQHPGRLSAHGAWPVSVIRSDVQPGALLWADMTGTGRLILISLPGLEAYTLPQRFSRPWGMIPLVQDLLPPTRVRVYDWDLDGRDDLLVAGKTGLDIMALASRGVFVDEFTLLSGEPGVSGFIDVGVGQSGRAARRFIAALSADARQLLVFRPNPDERLPWVQEVITDSLVSAKVVKVADLNRDSLDEIVVGDAGGVTVFYYHPDQQRWLRYSVDGSVAVADIQIHDFNGNGFPDMVTAPAETGPVTLYQNRGRGN